jgi:hypothetical protein
VSPCNTLDVPPVIRNPGFYANSRCSALIGAVIMIVVGSVRERGGGLLKPNRAVSLPRLCAPVDKAEMAQGPFVLLRRRGEGTVMLRIERKGKYPSSRW